jgi:cytoskeleton protein RodZ
MDAFKLYELGHTLKEHRERNALNREALALQTKISSKNLYAIEEGLVDQLPQAVFTKSFIRSYAEAMKMDLTEIDRQLADIFPPELINNINPKLTAGAREQAAIINSPILTQKIFTIIGAFILLILLGLGIWFYFSHIKPADSAMQDSGSTTQHSPEAVTQNAARPNAVTDNASRPNADADTADNNGEPGTTAADMTAGRAMPNSGQNAEAATLPSSDSLQTADAGDAATTAPKLPDPQAADTAMTSAGSFTPNPALSRPGAGYAHRIMISVISGICWIETRADNESSHSAEVPPERNVFLDFQERATIRLGNAGAVKIFYDGKEYLFKAASGEIKTFRFP